jgi:hypothetical protein
VTSSIAGSQVIEPDVLWVTDITQASHPERASSPAVSCSTPTGDGSSAHSIDARQAAALVAAALGMAIQNRLS